MYPKPLAKRQKIKGNIKDYGFDLISKKPTRDELKRWGISMPRGNSYIEEEVYDVAVSCVKKYWEFYSDKDEDLELSDDGRFTVDNITPERIASVWFALSKHESGDRDDRYYPRQFFCDIDVEHNGVKKHFDVVPLFARNIVDGVSVPNYMSAGCLAYGIGNISAYCDVLTDTDMARRAAWDWKYNVELSVMTFSRKWYIAESKKKGLPLDAAVIYYHGWDGGNESTDEYLSRDELNEKGAETRSSKRYYDAVKKLYLADIKKADGNKTDPKDDIPDYAIEKENEKMNIKNELGKIGVRGGHAINENVLPLEYGYPAYIEGKYVHNLSQRMTEEFGFENLEPETDKLKWAVIAKRGRYANCDTILYNHTNFSVNSDGELNSGKVIIIYPFENEEYEPLYEKMAETIARHMELPEWETRIRMSSNYENKNYYSALHYGKKYGIKHPLIVEYGYHVDIAGREQERTNQIISAFNELLEIEDNTKRDDTIALPMDSDMDLVGLRDKLVSVADMIDELLRFITDKE